MLQESAVSLNSVSRVCPPVSVESEADPRLVSALRFIDNHYSEPSLGLKHISESAGLSVWHFSRLFNAGMQMGLREYLKRLRLNHARKLLKSSPLSIKEIAAAVGYNHLSDFYHHFKSEYEISPLVFRRNSQRSNFTLENHIGYQETRTRQNHGVVETCYT